MKKIWIILGIVALVIIIVYRFFTGSYNNMVTYDEAVTTQWSNVENVYQRRADLIPNLVNTVKGYAEHEQETLEAVVNARSKATSTNISADNLTPEALQQFQEAQSGLSSALSRLLVVVEKYPDLKANESFLTFQKELEGSENRIAVERRKYNETVQTYNTYIRRFPRNMLAGMYGFERRAQFQAQEGAAVAPKVEF